MAKKRASSPISLRQQDEIMKRGYHDLLSYYNWDQVPLLMKIMVPIIMTVNILQLFAIIPAFALQMDPARIIDKKQLRRVFFWFLSISSLKGLLLNSILLTLLVPMYRKIEEQRGSIYLMARWFSVHFIITKVNCIIWWVWNQFGPHSTQIHGLTPFFVYIVLKYGQTEPNQSLPIFSLPCKISKWQRSIVIASFFIIFGDQGLACLQVLIALCLRKYVCKCFNGKKLTCSQRYLQKGLKKIIKRNDFIFSKQEIETDDKFMQEIASEPTKEATHTEQNPKIQLDNGQQIM